jgi:hypothetical protein
MNFAVGLSAAAHCPCWPYSLAIAVIAKIISTILLNWLTVKSPPFFERVDSKALSGVKGIPVGIPETR